MPGVLSFGGVQVAVGKPVRVRAVDPDEQLGQLHVVDQAAVLGVSRRGWPVRSTCEGHPDGPRVHAVLSGPPGGGDMPDGF
ncbi:hypothetical protein PZ61_0237605 [Streptomyces sp. MNU77]|nr:hypothetical protein PZ61_0237605 [Streptomyces sp. MNU77]